MSDKKPRERKSNGKKAVKLVEPKAAKGPKPGTPGTKEWYGKYPHVVFDSVREATKDDLKSLGAKCHGRVCDIKCVDTSKLRTINVQDAFQVKRTREAHEAFKKTRLSKKNKPAKKVAVAKVATAKVATN